MKPAITHDSTTRVFLCTALVALAALPACARSVGTDAGAESGVPSDGGSRAPCRADVDLGSIASRIRVEVTESTVTVGTEWGNVWGHFFREGERPSFDRVEYGACTAITIRDAIGASAGRVQVTVGARAFDVPSEQPPLVGYYRLFVDSTTALAFPPGALLRFSASGDVVSPFSVEVRMPAYVPATVNDAAPGTRPTGLVGNPVRLDWPATNDEVYAELSKGVPAPGMVARRVMCVFDGRLGHAEIPAEAIAPFGAGAMFVVVGGSCRNAVTAGNQSIGVNVVHGPGRGMDLR